MCVCTCRGCSRSSTRGGGPAEHISEHTLIETDSVLTEFRSVLICISIANREYSAPPSPFVRKLECGDSSPAHALLQYRALIACQ